MKQFGTCDHPSLFIFIAIILVFSAFSVSVADDTSVTECPPNQPPGLILINDTTFYTCLVNSFCYDVIAFDADSADSVTLMLIEGPIEFSPIQDTLVSVNVCFTPDTNGVYRFIWKALDLGGLFTYDTVNITVVYDNPVSIEDQYFSAVQCNLKQTRYLPLVISNPGAGGVTFELISGPGTIDVATGVISYVPDTSGTFLFEVAVYSACGGDTAMITDEVSLNSPPWVTGEDSILYLCVVEPICFDVFAYDPDGDSIEIIMTEGLGEFTITSDTSGQTCFMPADVDSTDYMFVFRAADSCISFNREIPANSDCECVDTVYITVVIDQPPVVYCPEPQSFLACQLDTFCFAIDSVIDPEGGVVNLNILSPLSDVYVDGQTVCVIGEESAEFDVVIEAVDECGNADTCSVPVTITANTGPYVSTATDFEMALCQVETICIDATAYDAESNLSSITTSYGTYNNDTHKICFDPDTAGVYTIILTAVDSCGLSATDTTLVTVDINELPYVDLGADFEFNVCGIPVVCVEDITVTDDNIDYISSSIGLYDPDMKQLCFEPDTSGIYTVILQVKDICGEIASDTVLVTVIGHEAPFVDLGDDFAITLCEPSEVCIHVNTIEAYQSLTISSGTYDEQTDQICLAVDRAGLYTLWVNVVDTCGYAAADTITFEVDMRSPPSVTGLQDTTLYLCSPQYVYLPVEITDPDNDIVSITSSLGRYENGAIRLIPYDSGHYQIIVTATDSCGFSAADTADLYVRTDQGVMIQLPDDTTVFTCELDTFCFPVAGVPEGAEVSVTGINAWYDTEQGTVCFYSECAVTNHISVTATTVCGSYTDSFKVTILCNSDPIVVLPADTSILVCDDPTICLPVGISDFDGNLAYVEAVGATYDPLFHHICFTADTAGAYRLSVTAYDSCEAFGYDEILVTVQLNEPPSCGVPADTSLFVCDFSEIRLPLTTEDIDGNLVGCQITNGPGSIVDGEWIFTPTQEGTVSVTIQCEDECGAVCEATFSVTFELNTPPSCGAPVDTTFFQCLPEPVCIPVGADDVNGNLASIEIVSGSGELVEGSWCYTPAGNEQVEAVIRFTDECAVYCEQTISASFIMNEAPTVSCPGDTTLFVCDLAEICLPGFMVGDLDNNLTNVEVLGGQLSEGTVCFAPVAGVNEITLIATDDCGLADTCYTTVEVVLNSAPVCNVPNDTTITQCLPEEVCLDVTGSDIDGNLESCEKVSGPGTLVDRLWCYTPSGDETAMVMVKCTDECGAVCESSFTVTFDLDEPPVIEDAELSIKLCEPGETRFFTVTASDPNNDILTYELLSGSGSIDPQTGEVTYNPEVSSVYTFEISVSDGCRADTATITDIVTINTVPTAFQYDTTIYLCNYGQICFGLVASDLDGDILTITQVEGPGEFLMASDTSGQTCFLPEPVDSADYMFVYRVADSCVEASGRALQESVYDTVNVTVVINRAPTISCPDLDEFIVCGTGTFCFHIPAEDLDGDALTYEIVSSSIGATVKDDTVCVTGSESGVYDVTVAVFDGCGASDTCSLAVTMISNTPPVVTTVGDFETFLCDATEICIDATAFDAEDNITEIVANIGTYDAGQVCFMPDTSGIYTVILTAVDACGETAADTTNITVDINGLPTVELAEDFTVKLCADSLVCFPALISDDNIVSMNVSFGDYNEATGEICFMIDTSGIYTVFVEITDVCGLTASDEVTITVIPHTEPIVDLGEDLSLFLCELSEICVDVNSPTGFQSLTTSLGEYNAVTNTICFTPTGAGVYTMAVDVVDTCGAVGFDTVVISVELNSGPAISILPDTTLYLCTPQYIELPVEVSDADGNLMQITSSMGRYTDGVVRFIPYDSGHFQIIVMAEDSCGMTAVDTSDVYIITDQGIVITVPDDTTVFVCELDTLCFPVDGIPEGAAVSVTGINTWFNAEANTVCFFSECATTNHIGVTVTTGCGTFSETFEVVVKCNSDPVVVLPPDQTMSVCGPTEICVPVGISDFDDNITDIQVEGGTYDALFHKVCIDAQEPGDYLVRITAYDACGALGVDETVVHVIDNSAPVITYIPGDTLFRQCNFETICLPVTIDDVDDNLVSVEVLQGYYDSDAGLICFTPEVTGRHCLTLMATDECGLADTVEICVTIEAGDFVQIECLDTAVTLCEVGNVCLPVSIDGNYLELTTSYGTFQGGNVCFVADTAGLYTIEVIAVAECNEDTCLANVQVEITEAVSITCPNDVDTLLCGPDTLVLDYEVSASVDSVYVASPAYISQGQLYVPVLQSGSFLMTMTAMGVCGDVSCVFTIKAVLNSAPVVTAANDTTLTTCELTEVCLPFTVTDADANIDSVVASVGIIDGSTLCLMPTEFGISTVVITAYDACDAFGADTVYVTVVEGDYADITCPEDVTVYACGPGNVCVEVPITPEDAEVTVLPDGTYDPATDSLCVYVEGAGDYAITVIAASLCSTDTCEFTLHVNMGVPPEVVCPPEIDTVLCLQAVDSIRIPVEVTGTGVNVNVNPFGTYSAGFVTFPVDSAGHYELEVIGYNDCGADTCQVLVNISDDEAPTLVLPMDVTVYRCPQDTDAVCVDGIFGTDSESLVTLTQTCGVAGAFDAVTTDSGVVCFVPDTLGVYEFCFEVNDGCKTATGSFFVNVEADEECDVCLRVSIDGGDCTPVGVVQEVSINIESKTPIGGFDLLITYDVSVIAFQAAVIEGGAAEDWEYFTFRLNSANCGTACPPGLVRFVGIADQNNGALHPPASAFEPNGVLVRIRFLVANDQNLGDQFLPIKFIWFDCGDNSFSSPSGLDYYLDTRIYNPEMMLLWDEEDDVNFPEANRPFGLGSGDSCLVGDKTFPIRCVEFINGGICVIHPDTLDDRGDVNLNNVAYEIADAVTFSNYFIYGLMAFRINIPGQIAATDVNADGLTLTVADLVLLVRIIVGDADPVVKLTPYPDELVVSNSLENGVMKVTTQATDDIGAALFVYDIKGDVQLGDPHLTSDTRSMTMLQAVVDNQLRVLIFDFGSERIKSGYRELVEVPVTGDGYLELSRVEVVDYQGRPYSTVYKGSVLPSEFSLQQNYPNPFNPLTTIGFSLPKVTDWRLDVYNINGKLVRSFNGSGDVGNITVQWDGTNATGNDVASGIYLYRLNATEFSQTKKMILLK